MSEKNNEKQIPCVLDEEVRKWRSYVEKKLSDAREATHSFSDEEIEKFKKVNQEKMKKLSESGEGSDAK